MNFKQQYSNYLIEQFVEAEGMKNDLKLPEIVNELKHWLEHQKKHIILYKKALKELNVPYDNIYCAELGKGTEDSIVYIQETTTMITPYIATKNQTSKNIILPFDIKIKEGHIILKREEGTKIINGFNRYITQNPYIPSDLEKWVQLHLKNQPITIGVYGKTADKNRDQKIKLIKNIKEKSYANFIYIENEVYQDTYVSIFTTKPSQQEKILQKHL